MAYYRTRGLNFMVERLTFFNELNPGCASIASLKRHLPPPETGRFCARRSYFRGGRPPPPEDEEAQERYGNVYIKRRRRQRGRGWRAKLCIAARARKAPLMVARAHVVVAWRACVGFVGTLNPLTLNPRATTDVIKLLRVQS